MSYKRTPFKMAPKSPLTKALKGNQGKLPQHLQEAIKAAPESPAKAMMGPGVQKEAGKTGTAGKNSAAGKNAASAPVQGPPRKTSNTLSKSAKNTSYAPGTPEGKAQAKFTPKPKTKSASATAPKAKAPAATAPKAKAKPKYDKELNSLVASRKGLKKGTAEYNKVQNRINEKLGSSVRRREEQTTKVASKKPATASTAASKVASSRGLTPKPAAKKPAAKKAPSQADKFENVLAKESAKGPMGSETRSKAPAAKKPAAKKPVAKKPAAKKTVGQKVKGTVRNARLAQLDRKANRQEARGARKTARKTAKADKLREKADKLSSPAKQTLPKGLYQSAKKDLRSKREVPVPTRKTPIGGPGTKGLSKESNEKIARLGVKAGRKASGKPNLVRTPAKKYKK